MPRKLRRNPECATDQKKEPDWATLYGQPKETRTLESYETQWCHWRVLSENPPMLVADHDDHDDDDDDDDHHHHHDVHDDGNDDEGGEQRPLASAALPLESFDDKSNVGSPVRLRRKPKSRSTSPRSEPLVNDTHKYERRISPAFLIEDEDSGILQRVLLGRMLVYVIVTLLAAGVVYFAWSRFTLMVRAPNHVLTFDKKLEQLKEEFPSQPRHNWGIIRSAFAEVLNRSDYQYGPAILIILASRKDQGLATCFSEKLALSLAKTFNKHEEPIVLNGAKLRKARDSIAAKHTIDDFVNQKDNFVMQFNSLEKIDSYTSSLFHSLCDYYNSPFKERAIFIFTVHTNEEVEGRSRKEYDQMADRVLNHSWAELDVNKRTALIARLTGSTILLRRESRRSC